MTTTRPRLHPRVSQKQDELVALCRQFGVQRLDLVGSATSDEWDSFTSDYDFLVTYPNGYDFGVWDGRLLDLQSELKWTMGRPVDLINAGGIKPHHRDGIEQSRVMIYDASSDT